MSVVSIETGPFTCYFHSLPEASRNKWIERLGAVAHRKVVIWDPKNQMMEMPVLRPGKDRREAGSEDDERIEWLGNGSTLKMRPVKTW